MLALGYGALGVLVGVLAGLSSSEIAAPLMAALFTFAGGTATFLLKEDRVTRRVLGTILLSFAPLCIAGLLGGIVIKENRLLTNLARAERLASASPSGSAKPYLKSIHMKTANAVNTRYRNGEITAAAAYEELWRIVQE